MHDMVEIVVTIPGEEYERLCVGAARRNISVEEFAGRYVEQMAYRQPKAVFAPVEKPDHVDLDRWEGFWKKVKVRSDGCWQWMGGLNTTGYGVFTGYSGSGTRLAHRILYEWLCGPLVPSDTIDHVCCNPRCVNPEHFEIVSSSENSRRAGDRRRGGPKPPKYVRERGPDGRVTHCVHGHEFTPENTYMSPNGSKICKTCLKARHGVLNP